MFYYVIPQYKHLFLNWPWPIIIIRKCFMSCFLIFRIILPVVDSLLCPDSMILCSLVDDEFWLLNDDILLITLVVISSFVDFWLLLCVLLFSWLPLIVSLSTRSTSLCELIGISLLLIFFWSNLWFVSCKEK